MDLSQKISEAIEYQCHGFFKQNNIMASFGGCGMKMTFSDQADV